MASLYKERRKRLVKLPTMHYTVTDMGEDAGRAQDGKLDGGGWNRKARWKYERNWKEQWKPAEDSLNQKCRIT